MNISNYKKYLFYLIAISLIVRCFLAYVLELGGEEAYYWTFALYPKLSHLDQPPMIGWLIQLFTNNLTLSSEFFTRFVSICIGTVNTWIIFVLGRRMKNELTGLFAAFLYTTSIYGSIITGTLVSPDTPQSMFLLLAIYFLHEGLIVKYSECEESKMLCSMALIMSGVFIGFALLSKFSSGLLYIGALIYIIFYDKEILKRPQIYISMLISLLILSPVIIWNIKYNFIGFRYLDKVVLAFSDNISLKNIVTEVCRQLIYNNPVNIMIAVAAIFSFKKVRYVKTEQYRLLISLFLPFLILGLFSVGFFPLIMLSAAFLESRYRHRTRIKLPGVLKNSIIVYSLLVIAGVTQVFTGFLNFESKKEPEMKIGFNDISIDRYGWSELSKEFRKLRSMDVALGLISDHAYIVSDNYSSAAHYDYYLAGPNKIFVKTIGNINDTRKYAFTTQERGGFKIGESAYYIESSRDKVSGMAIGQRYYECVETAKTIYIERMGQPVVRYTIYRLKGLKSLPGKELISVPEIYR